MRDRISIVGATGALLGALGLCCGLPVLLSLGFLGAFAGLSLGSWVLLALGLATVAFAVWRRHQRRHRSPRPAQQEKRDRDEHEDTGVQPREGS
jgi:threonine/homoserine/homoserine lactone efflux protein